MVGLPLPLVLPFEVEVVTSKLTATATDHPSVAASVGASGLANRTISDLRP